MTLIEPSTKPNTSADVPHKDPSPIAEPRKKRLLLQALLGVIAGALVTFGLVFGILQGLLSFFGADSNQGNTVIALIGTAFIDAFIALLISKRFFLFGLIHLITSTIILSFMTYILYYLVGQTG